jgi:hypothetical protein
LNDHALRLSPGHLLTRAAFALAGAALLTLAAFATGTAPPPAAATPWILAETPRAVDAQLALRYDRAVQALRAQDYAGAYGRFADLADQGHAASAQWALAMVSQGPAVFGSEWSATRGQLQRWSTLSAREARDRTDLIPEHDRGE